MQQQQHQQQQPNQHEEHEKMQQQLLAVLIKKLVHAVSNKNRNLTLKLLGCTSNNPSSSSKFTEGKDHDDYDDTFMESLLESTKNTQFVHDFLFSERRQKQQQIEENQAVIFPLHQDSKQLSDSSNLVSNNNNNNNHHYHETADITEYYHAIVQQVSKAQTTTTTTIFENTFNGLLMIPSYYESPWLAICDFVFFLQQQHGQLSKLAATTTGFSFVSFFLQSIDNNDNPSNHFTINDGSPAAISGTSSSMVLSNIIIIEIQDFLKRALTGAGKQHKSQQQQQAQLQQQLSGGSSSSSRYFYILRLIKIIMDPIIATVNAEQEVGNINADNHQNNINDVNDNSNTKNNNNTNNSNDENNTDWITIPLELIYAIISLLSSTHCSFCNNEEKEDFGVDSNSKVHNNEPNVTPTSVKLKNEILDYIFFPPRHPGDVINLTTRKNQTNNNDNKRKIQIIRSDRIIVWLKLALQLYPFLRKKDVQNIQQTIYFNLIQEQQQQTTSFCQTQKQRPPHQLEIVSRLSISDYPDLINLIFSLSKLNNEISNKGLSAEKSHQTRNKNRDESKRNQNYIIDSTNSNKSDSRNRNKVDDTVLHDNWRLLLLKLLFVASSSSTEKYSCSREDNNKSNENHLSAANIIERVKEVFTSNFTSFSTLELHDWILSMSIPVRISSILVDEKETIEHHHCYRQQNGDNNNNIQNKYEKVDVMDTNQKQDDIQKQNDGSHHKSTKIKNNNITNNSHANVIPYWCHANMIFIILQSFKKSAFSQQNVHNLLSKALDSDNISDSNNNVLSPRKRSHKMDDSESHVNKAKRYKMFSKQEQISSFNRNTIGSSGSSGGYLYQQPMRRQRLLSSFDGNHYHSDQCLDLWSECWDTLKSLAFADMSESTFHHSASENDKNNTSGGDAKEEEEDEYEYDDVISITLKKIRHLLDGHRTIKKKDSNVVFYLGRGCFGFTRANNKNYDDGCHSQQQHNQQNNLDNNEGDGRESYAIVNLLDNAGKLVYQSLYSGRGRKHQHQEKKTNNDIDTENIKNFEERNEVNGDCNNMKQQCQVPCCNNLMVVEKEVEGTEEQLCAKSWIKITNEILIKRLSSVSSSFSHLKRSSSHSSSSITGRNSSSRYSSNRSNHKIDDDVLNDSFLAVIIWIVIYFEIPASRSSLNNELLLGALFSDQRCSSNLFSTTSDQEESSTTPTLPKTTLNVDFHNNKTTVMKQAKADIASFYCIALAVIARSGKNTKGSIDNHNGFCNSKLAQSFASPWICRQHSDHQEQEKKRHRHGKKNISNEIILPSSLATILPGTQSTIIREKNYENRYNMVSSHNTESLMDSLISISKKINCNFDRKFNPADISAGGERERTLSWCSFSRQHRNIVASSLSVDIFLPLSEILLLLPNGPATLLSLSRKILLLQKHNNLQNCVSDNPHESQFHNNPWQNKSQYPPRNFSQATKATNASASPNHAGGDNHHVEYICDSNPANFSSGGNLHHNYYENDIKCAFHALLCILFKTNSSTFSPVQSNCGHKVDENFYQSHYWSYEKFEAWKIISDCIVINRSPFLPKSLRTWLFQQIIEKLDELLIEQIPEVVVGLSTADDNCSNGSSDSGYNNSDRREYEAPINDPRSASSPKKERRKSTNSNNAASISMSIIVKHLFRTCLVRFLHFFHTHEQCHSDTNDQDDQDLSSQQHDNCNENDTIVDSSPIEPTSTESKTTKLPMAVPAADVEEDLAGLFRLIMRLFFISVRISRNNIVVATHSVTSSTPSTTDSDECATCDANTDIHATSASRCQCPYACKLHNCETSFSRKSARKHDRTSFSPTHNCSDDDDDAVKNSKTSSQVQQKVKQKQEQYKQQELLRKLRQIVAMGRSIMRQSIYDTAVCPHIYQIDSGDPARCYTKFFFPSLNNRAAIAKEVAESMSPTDRVEVIPGAKNDGIDNDHIEVDGFYKYNSRNNDNEMNHCFLEGKSDSKNNSNAIVNLCINKSNCKSNNKKNGSDDAKDGSNTSHVEQKENEEDCKNSDAVLLVCCSVTMQCMVLMSRYVISLGFSFHADQDSDGIAEHKAPNHNLQYLQKYSQMSSILSSPTSMSLDDRHKSPTEKSEKCDMATGSKTIRKGTPGVTEDRTAVCHFPCFGDIKEEFTSQERTDMTEAYSTLVKISNNKYSSEYGKGTDYHGSNVYLAATSSGIDGNSNDDEHGKKFNCEQDNLNYLPNWLSIHFETQKPKSCEHINDSSCFPQGVSINNTVITTTRSPPTKLSLSNDISYINKDCETRKESIAGPSTTDVAFNCTKEKELWLALSLSDAMIDVWNCSHWESCITNADIRSEPDHSTVCLSETRQQGAQRKKVDAACFVNIDPKNQKKDREENRNHHCHIYNCGDYHRLYNLAGLSIMSICNLKLLLANTKSSRSDGGDNKNYVVNANRRHVMSLFLMFQHDDSRCIGKFFNVSADVIRQSILAKRFFFETSLILTSVLDHMDFLRELHRLPDRQGQQNDWREGTNKKQYQTPADIAGKDIETDQEEQKIIFRSTKFTDACNGNNNYYRHGLTSTNITSVFSGLWKIYIAICNEDSAAGYIDAYVDFWAGEENRRQDELQRMVYHPSSHPLKDYKDTDTKKKDTGTPASMPVRCSLGRLEVSDLWQNYSPLLSAPWACADAEKKQRRRLPSTINERQTKKSETSIEMKRANVSIRHIRLKFLQCLDSCLVSWIQLLGERKAESLAPNATSPIARVINEVFRKKDYSVDKGLLVVLLDFTEALSNDLYAGLFCIAVEGKAQAPLRNGSGERGGEFPERHKQDIKALGSGGVTVEMLLSYLGVIQNCCKVVLVIIPQLTNREILESVLKVYSHVSSIMRKINLRIGNVSNLKAIRRRKRGKGNMATALKKMMLILSHFLPSVSRLATRTLLLLLVKKSETGNVEARGGERSSTDTDNVIRNEKTNHWNKNIKFGNAFPSHLATVSGLPLELGSEEGFANQAFLQCLKNQQFGIGRQTSALDFFHDISQATAAKAATSKVFIVGATQTEFTSDDRNSSSRLPKNNFVVSKSGGGDQHDDMGHVGFDSFAETNSLSPTRPPKRNQGKIVADSVLVTATSSSSKNTHHKSATPTSTSSIFVNGFKRRRLLDAKAANLLQISSRKCAVGTSRNFFAKKGSSGQKQEDDSNVFSEEFLSSSKDAWSWASSSAILAMEFDWSESSNIITILMTRQRQEWLYQQQNHAVSRTCSGADVLTCDPKNGVHSNNLYLASWSQSRRIELSKIMRNVSRLFQTLDKEISRKRSNTAIDVLDDIAINEEKDRDMASIDCKDDHCNEKGGIGIDCNVHSEDEKLLLLAFMLPRTTKIRLISLLDAISSSLQKAVAVVLAYIRINLSREICCKKGSADGIKVMKEEEYDVVAPINIALAESMSCIVAWLQPPISEYAHPPVPANPKLRFETGTAMAMTRAETTSLLSDFAVGSRTLYDLEKKKMTSAHNKRSPSKSVVIDEAEMSTVAGPGLNTNGDRGKRGRSPNKSNTDHTRTGSRFGSIEESPACFRRLSIVLNRIDKIESDLRKVQDSLMILINGIDTDPGEKCDNFDDNVDINGNTDGVDSSNGNTTDEDDCNLRNPKTIDSALLYLSLLGIKKKLSPPKFIAKEYSEDVSDDTECKLKSGHSRSNFFFSCYFFSDQELLSLLSHFYRLIDEKLITLSKAKQHFSSNQFLSERKAASNTQRKMKTRQHQQGENNILYNNRSSTRNFGKKKQSKTTRKKRCKKEERGQNRPRQQRTCQIPKRGSICDDSLHHLNGRHRLIDEWLRVDQGIAREEGLSRRGIIIDNDTYEDLEDFLVEG